MSHLAGTLPLVVAVRHVARSQIVEMLRRAAAAHGMTLREFRDAGTGGGMRGADMADLRDLWLIWGSSIDAGD